VKGGSTFQYVTRLYTYSFGINFGVFPPRRDRRYSEGYIAFPMTPLAEEKAATTLAEIAAAVDERLAGDEAARCGWYDMAV
jgi:hypothetical protein